MKQLTQGASKCGLSTRCTSAPSRANILAAVGPAMTCEKSKRGRQRGDCLLLLARRRWRPFVLPQHASVQVSSRRHRLRNRFAPTVRPRTTGPGPRAVPAPTICALAVAASESASGVRTAATHKPCPAKAFPTRPVRSPKPVASTRRSAKVPPTTQGPSGFCASRPSTLAQRRAKIERSFVQRRDKARQMPFQPDVQVERSVFGGMRRDERAATSSAVQGADRKERIEFKVGVGDVICVTATHCPRPSRIRAIKAATMPQAAGADATASGSECALGARPKGPPEIRTLRPPPGARVSLWPPRHRQATGGARPDLARGFPPSPKVVLERLFCGGAVGTQMRVRPIVHDVGAGE